MVDHSEAAFQGPNLPAGACQALEGAGGGQLVKEVAVDHNEVCAPAARAHKVIAPDLVKYRKGLGMGR